MVRELKLRQVGGSVGATLPRIWLIASTSPRAIGCTLWKRTGAFC